MHQFLMFVDSRPRPYLINASIVVTTLPHEHLLEHLSSAVIQESIAYSI